MTRIFDNIETLLGPHLQSTLKDFETVDIAVGYFNVRGWHAFDEIVSRKPDRTGPTIRILIGMLASTPDVEALNELQRSLDGSELEEADNAISQERRNALIAHLRQQLMRGVQDSKSRATLRSLAEQIRGNKVELKIYTRRPLHGKTYIFHRNDLNQPDIAFVGSSNLTPSGLTSNYELNVDVVDHDGASKLSEWFDDRWNDPQSRAISDTILELLEESWASETPKQPYEVFLKLCFDLSRDVRDGIADFSIPNSIKSQLLEYQINAVSTLARRVMKIGGTMLGDVVGLGKTITAVAVAMMLREEHGLLPLIVCPKNLVQMWERYLKEYHLPGEVVSYSVAHTELPKLSQYKFVIVDESHTLRNDTRRDYQAVREYIERVGANVLLLTATPYNRRFIDVANQLALFIAPDDDLGITPIHALQADPQLTNRVDGKINTLEAFKKSEDPEDWKRLMSEHLVRRTRSFIKKHYSKTDAAGNQYLEFANGAHFTFPKRIAKPIDHVFGTNDPAQLMTDDVTLDTLKNLALPRYALADFVDVTQTAQLSKDEQQIIDDFKRSKGQVAGFVRTTFYKRLSSCGYAFTISLERHIARNELFLHAISNEKPLPVGTISEADLLDDDDLLSATESDVLSDEATVAARYEALLSAKPRNIKWLSSQAFTPALAESIARDTEALTALLDRYGQWSIERDSKFAELLKLVTQTHGNEKVLVFTEYKDTANYLADALIKAGVNAVASATGDDKNPTELARRFSPESNREEGKEPDRKGELRVLVSTDVLSEGQNLQDGHIIFNYDLPWAIVRLIQRAGRVDRIGQKSDQVLLYSIFHGSLSEVLSLRQRIADRLEQNAQAFGSDESFFGSKQEVEAIKDLYDGQLDEADDIDDVDAASLAHQIWVAALEQHPDLAHRAMKLPDLSSTTRSLTSRDAELGLACHVQTNSQLDGFGWVSASGEMQLLTATEMIRTYECEIDEQPSVPLANQDDLVLNLVRGPLAATAATAGALKGVRKKVWNRLGNSLTPISAEAREALDELYQRPLKREAERRLQNALRNGVSDEDLATRLVSLLDEGALVVPNKAGSDDLRIISMMGVQ